MTQADPWKDMRAKLQPGARVVANVGKGKVALRAFCQALSGKPDDGQ